MYFDTEAYAEGICNSAAGSSIESFVDTLDATIRVLKETGNNQMASEWSELRNAIVSREQANGEETVFGEAS